MHHIKVVTICGSMRFKQEMIEKAIELEVENNYAVIQCVYKSDNNDEQVDKENLSKIHFKKIEISDAIYVVNVNGYVGSQTRKEIEYAKSLGKEILSLEPLNEKTIY